MPAILIFSQGSHSHCGHFASRLTGSWGQDTTVTEGMWVGKAVEETRMASSLAIIVLTVTETELAATLSRQMGASSRLARAG